MRSLKELMDLKGRTALVTGGAGCIGRMFCETLAELGADIVVLDLDPGACEDTARGIQHSYGVQALPLTINLADEDALRSVPDRISSEPGRLDILINCAAYVGMSRLDGWACPFQEQKSAAWREAIEVNLTAAFILTQACADLLRASGHGSVVNISSIYGMVGPDMRLYDGLSMGNPAAYAASKGGLLQLTRWLAAVLAPEVRVNTISPGGLWRNQPETFRERYNQRTPLRRMATEEDLKGAIAYLASDLSGYVTGHNLVVDGGWTVW
ncbi:MAG: SDR family oxidoreductase [Deltaproteobacteria bacterium]|nr:SDR family oxidoreductase [Deltaproteobacteria bacterium]MBW2018603.1 SDR family oxidoreductase [Deltaproteobacteria bacterium]MBW2073869.1 SDR family oxidoreductase [Deltaproteobacteria bacterium]